MIQSFIYYVEYDIILLDTSSIALTTAAGVGSMTVNRATAAAIITSSM